MNQQINGIDENRVPRVYGIGRTREQAMQNCIKAAREYLNGSRRDIKTLYLVEDNTGNPIMYAGLNVQWQIKR